MTSWAKQSTSASSWTKNTETATTAFSKQTKGSQFLLLENGSYILQESSGKIQLEVPIVAGSGWSKQNES